MTEPTAQAVAGFLMQARDRLEDEGPANILLLRDFDTLPDIPSLSDMYGLDACAIAGDPMYRGVLGMTVVEAGPDQASEAEALHAHWPDHDSFFLHFKAPESKGEDGDFAEDLDAHMARILETRPDVVIVTGDLSTPSTLGSHSWHLVPMLLSSDTCRRDHVTVFGENACAGGGLGRMPAK